MHISDYRGKIPFLMIHLHIFIYDFFYGLCRYMVKRKFAFTFEFTFYYLFTSVNIDMVNNDIEVPSGQLKRFNQSLIDPKCLLKIAATSFCFDNNLSFRSNVIFYCILLFLLEKYGPKWLRIIINTKFLKVLKVYLFRFANRFRCHLNLKISLAFFWLISIVFETRSDHYFLPNVLIKMRFLISW